MFREISIPYYDPNRMHDNQVFQDWMSLVDDHDKFLQLRNRHVKADATDAIALLEGEDCSLFTFCGDVVIFVRVIDEERKGR